MEIWQARDPNRKSTFYQSIAIAAIAGALTNPLDVVKNYHQAGKHFTEKRGYANSLEVAKFVYEKAGWRGFFSGSHLTALALFGRQFTFFALYDWLCEDTVSWWAAAKAKFWMNIFMTPIDLARTRCQVTFGKQGTLEYLGHVVEHEGFYAMWRGLGPLLMKDIPFTIAYWTIYDQLRKEVIYNINPDVKESSSFEKNFLWPFAIGTFTGAVVTVMTQPLDVIKNVMQGSNRVRLLPLGGWQRKSFDHDYWFDYFKKNGGFRRAAFAGLGPRLLKVPVSCGMLLGIYEFSKADLKDTCGRLGFLFE